MKRKDYLSKTVDSEEDQDDEDEDEEEVGYIVSLVNVIVI